LEKETVIEVELKLCGYFCIVTSGEMMAREALELYKADKTFLGNRSARVYTEESLGGKYP